MVEKLYVPSKSEGEPGDGLPSHLAIRELRYLMRILGWGFPAARDPDSLEFQDSMQNRDKSLQARCPAIGGTVDGFWQIAYSEIASLRSQ